LRAVVAVDLIRSRRGISRRDAHAREHARARGLVDAYRAALEQCEIALVLVDRSGGVVHASARAEDLLAAYADAAPAIAERLGGGGAVAPLVVPGPRGRLRVRELEGRAWAPSRALVLDEQRVRAPSPESLHALGLTRREAQVLRLVCCGRSNDQVALELSISSRTVGKHLERAYAKLGVGSRGAAVARTLGLSSGDRPGL
jgi:DNA-binding CsgD family transcriptional regulator